MGSFEIYRKFDGSSLKVERQTVHISDDTGRIAMLEKRTIGTDPSPLELTRYIYSNHLQSASLELDEVGEVISYEEYHPYGTTSYQAMNASIKATAKRYRYTGKERDDESGLYYHGARYYIPWLARWTAIDPMEAKYAGMSPYNYSFNNPVMYNDPSGADPEDENFPTNPSVGQVFKSKSGDNHIYTDSERWAILLDDFEFTGQRPETQGSNVGSDYLQYGFDAMGISENGFYAVREYTSEGFSDIDNYLTFGNNTAGKLYNILPTLYYGFKDIPNVSLSGIGSDIKSFGNYIVEKDEKYRGGLFNSNFRQDALDLLSDPHFYEDIAPLLLTRMPYGASTGLIGFEVKTFSVAANATKTGGRVFWSGGDIAKNTAMDFAMSNGMKTLEMTTGGRMMNAVSPYLPRSVSSPIWDGLSKNFARSASGNINVFQNAAGVSLKSTWRRIEYPILQNNNIFYHIVK